MGASPIIFSETPGTHIVTSLFMYLRTSEPKFYLVGVLAIEEAEGCLVPHVLSFGVASKSLVLSQHVLHTVPMPGTCTGPN